MKKSLIGAIGEQMVSVKLMQQGWNVLNANASITNFESIDLVCINPETDEISLVQVKTQLGQNPNFNVGCTIQKVDTLLEKIKVPWVFVQVIGEGLDMEFYYFILSRQEVADLILTSNEWYLNDWKRTKELSDNCTVNLKLKWLKGEGESETPLHSAYVCSLDHDSENCWQKLWE